MATVVHPTAVIAPTAQLGRNVAVGPYAVIEDEVVVGDGCEIHAHAVLKRFTRLGESNRIFEHAVIGGEPQDVKFRGEASACIIGHDNIFREGVTINRGCGEHTETRVGNNNFLMAYSHVAHNCELADDIIVANNVALAGHIRIEDHAFLSGGVVVHQFTRIGKYAMIGGNSKIVQDCLPFFTTDGVPGRTRGLNLVGLRRGGFSHEQIQAMKQAYRTLFYSQLHLDAALLQLEAMEDANVQYLVAFIRSSQRGFAHAARD